MSKKYYTIINVIKNVLIENDCAIENAIEFYDGDIPKMIKTEAAKIESITVRNAFLAVMLSGAYREDFGGVSFLMPKTSDAVKAVKTIDKALKKGRKLSICFYPWDCEVTNPEPVWIKVY